MPGQSALSAAVEIEDDIYSYVPADNGAGPLWCHGSTVVVRRGDEVLISGLETLPEAAPLNNCRWTLYGRDAGGWSRLHRDTSGRTREPSPLALLGNGDLLVSANPTLTAPDAYNGPAEPCVWRFSPGAAPAREHPRWHGEPAFSEHSYRTLCADAPHNEALCLQNVGYDKAHASFLNRDGAWQDLPPLVWPRGDEYPRPQPLRLCYPNVFLRDRGAYFFGVGDIVEPVEAWKEAKHRITGRDWDYVFRRLFYAWTPDVIQKPFGPWTEIANLDATAGQTRNGDIHVDADGTAHLLWCETNVDGRLRDRFFSGQKVVQTLKYAQVDQGRKGPEHILAQLEEGQEGLLPDLARFHLLPDGRLLVLAAFTDTGKQAGRRYRLAQVGHNTDAATTPNWTDIPFTRPLPGTFLTNTVRGGSAPSEYLDLVGMAPDKKHTLAYARVRIR